VSNFGCPGCGISSYFGSHARYSKPTLHFEQLENKEWTIITAPENEWIFETRIALYFPQYFPRKYLGVDMILHNNFFYSAYKLNYKDEIVLFINFPDAFYISKGVRGGEKYGSVGFGDNSNSCIERKLKRVTVAVNAVDVDFDNRSVYILKDEQKNIGTELKLEREAVADMTEINDHNIYNLASKDLIEDKQVPSVFPLNKHPGISTFLFKFPMTCTDFEDAVFVIDGLYRHGERLPPLKVKMNYLDFDRVPQYRGDQPEQQEQG
jgi:hypothetical protein